MTEGEKLAYIIRLIQSENRGDSIELMVPQYAGNKVIGYQGIHEDLNQCKLSLLELKTNKYPDLIKSSLFHTASVLYGKCFTDATSAKYPKLELIIFKNKAPELINRHNELMDIRHNFVAHRGVSEHDLGFPYVSFKTEGLKRQVLVKQLRRKTISELKIDTYIELVDFILPIVEEKYKKAGIKVWDHLLEKYTDEQLIELRIAGPNINRI